MKKSLRNPGLSSSAFEQPGPEWPNVIEKTCFYDGEGSAMIHKCQSDDSTKIMPQDQRMIT